MGICGLLQDKMRATHCNLELDFGHILIPQLSILLFLINFSDSFSCSHPQSHTHRHYASAYPNTTRVRLFTHCLVDQATVQKMRLWMLCDFFKALNTLPSALALPADMMSVTDGLYEWELGWYTCPWGLLEVITISLGVKQGCPLSPAHFKLYINSDQIV